MSIYAFYSILFNGLIWQIRQEPNMIGQNYYHLSYRLSDLSQISKLRTNRFGPFNSLILIVSF